MNKRNLSCHLSTVKANYFVFSTIEIIQYHRNTITDEHSLNKTNKERIVSVSCLGINTVCIIFTAVRHSKLTERVNVSNNPLLRMFILKNSVQ
jgi:hypothetical protein